MAQRRRQLTVNQRHKKQRRFESFLAYCDCSHIIDHYTVKETGGTVNPAPSGTSGFDTLMIDFTDMAEKKDASDPEPGGELPTSSSPVISSFGDLAESG